MRVRERVREPDKEANREEIERQELQKRRRVRRVRGKGERYWLEKR